MLKESKNHAPYTLFYEKILEYITPLKLSLFCEAKVIRYYYIRGL